MPRTFNHKALIHTIIKLIFLPLEKREEREKMKRIVTVLAASLLIVGLLTSAVHAYTTKMSVTPSTLAVGKVGKIFKINVTVTDVINLYGFEFKLGYNATLLDALNITLGSFFPNSTSYVLKNYINHTEGYLWFAATLLAPEPAKIGSGVLATITFNVTLGTIHPETTQCDLHLYDTILGDNTGQPIAHDTVDGQYTFSPIRGDINGDGIVDIFDIVIVATAFGSGSSDPSSPWDQRADLNGDNKIDILDAVILAINFGTTG